MIDKKEFNSFMKTLIKIWTDKNCNGDIIEVSFELQEFDIPKNTNKDELLSKLKADGFITYTNLCGVNKREISLTDKGKLYFENKKIKTKEKIKADMKYIITTIIAGLALVVSIIALIKSFL